MRSETAFRLDLTMSGPMLAGAIVLGSISGASPQDVVEMVEGQPITTIDVEHRAGFLRMTNRNKKPPEENEALDGLVREIHQIAEAKRNGIEVSDRDIDEAYEGVATRIGLDPKKLTQLLRQGGASEDTLKRRLRAKIAFDRLAKAKQQSPERSETK